MITFAGLQTKLEFFRGEEVISLKTLLVMSDFFLPLMDFPFNVLFSFFREVLS